MALTDQELDFLRDYIESKSVTGNYSKVAKEISQLSEEQVKALIAEAKADRIAKIDRQISNLQAERNSLTS